MDRFIKGAVAICDAVKAYKKSNKTVNLSFDEWNVWFHSKGNDKKIEKWTVAPHQIEDVYTFEDALLVGSLLITLQNNCDRVKMACLAQLVNVIAPIMTDNGGKAWAQTIFYPFMYASGLGNGEALRAIVESDKYYSDAGYDVPYLSSSVIYNANTNEVIVYAVNRSLSDSIELDVELQGFEDCTLCEHIMLYSDDLKATNDKDTERVAPISVPVSVNERVVLKKHSWNMLRYKIED